jgi:hypothetical protein
VAALLYHFKIEANDAANMGGLSAPNRVADIDHTQPRRWVRLGDGRKRPTTRNDTAPELLAFASAGAAG